MNQALLRTQNLAIGYMQRLVGPRIIAEDIGVNLQEGQFVCLIGPNGVGKSTLLRTIAGMQPPLRGNVLLRGAPISTFTPVELAKHLSIVLTERINTGMLSAYALVALGRYPYTDWTGRLTTEDETVVRWAIETVDAVALADRNIGELSDGERQKIMIARALAQNTPLILLDEPTAYLDLTRRLEIVQTLRRLAHETGKAILLSIHDLDLALRSADMLWLLPTSGKLSVGTPEDMVLNGTFERAFSSDGILFDALTGAFRIESPRIGQITLSGSGLPLIWTQRALARSGIQIATSPATVPIHVNIDNESGLPVWEIKQAEQTARYYNLDELITALLGNLA